MSDAAIPPETVDSRRVARGLGSTILARMGAVVEIVAQPLYVLMFGLAGYGMYAVMWSTINLIENICDLGMTSAMQRTVPKAASDADAAEALRTALLFGVGPCLAVACLISLYAHDLAPLLNVAEQDEHLLIPAVRIFVWTLPLWAFVEVATSALRARMVFGAEIRLRIVWEQIIRLVLAGLFFFLGMGLKGLFIAHIISLAITAGLCVRLLRQYYRLDLLFAGKWWGDCARHTLLAGLSVLPSNIVARMFSESPTLILNQLLPGAAGASASGLFTIARKLSSVVQLVRVAFVYVMAPLAASAERTDRAQVASIYSYAVRVIVAIAFPLAAVIGGGRYSILSLFGKQADVAAAAVVILVFARALEAMLGISLPVLQVIAHYKHQITASVFGLAVAILAGRELVGPLDPITGITLAMAIGFVTMATIPMIQLYLTENLHPFDRRFPRVIVVVTAVAVTAGVVADVVDIAFVDEVAIPLIIAIGAASIWTSLRLALPLDDRASLGKLAVRLRLLPQGTPI
ncbi:lipopolysaccharide biosynthesis protein [Parafrankia sp. BMG5.11]|uniref:lipopolysaccharide biosynthesis protein n=1 Tax=Parafrankia sp. BMG5.11 TaxID=222540 RepID=UPI00104036E6|nr:oligosaccharide flippase family protein [Parafrankia sp. BMG5.11]TCJ37451.1 polysaccharide biosynthesis protein [Parafrankia sp. BMG5.11]